MRYVSRVILVFAAIIAMAGAARAGDPVLALLDPYFRIQTDRKSTV